MNMYSTLKVDRLNKNKSRYDDDTLKNQMIKESHNARLEAAAQKEKALIARMAHTMDKHKAAIGNLQQAISLNKVKKAERVDPIDLDRVKQNFSTVNHPRNRSTIL